MATPQGANCSCLVSKILYIYILYIYYIYILYIYINQWEFHDHEMAGTVPYRLGPYLVGIFPYIALTQALYNLYMVGHSINVVVARPVFRAQLESKWSNFFMKTASNRSYQGHSPTFQWLCCAICAIHYKP